ncbi:MAG: hypothetical protein ABI855_20065 [Bacteroidota bacterium]
MKLFEYITLTGELPFPKMQIADVQGFIKLAQLLEASCIFVIANKEKDKSAPPDSFLFLDDRTLYTCDAGGYRTLEENAEATKNNFPDSVSYYDARKNGFTSFKEYDECRKAGTQDKSAYAKAMRLGFIDNFEKFTQRAEKEKERTPQQFDPSLLSTALALYEYAVANGFKDFGDFENAFFKGFNTQAEAEDARKKGFVTASEYEGALRMGITTPKEYHEAKHNNIANKKEYDKFIFLKRNTHNRFSFDEAHLIYALKMFENGKKLSINKLRTLLQEQQKEYLVQVENGESLLPEWYSQKLITDDNFKMLLRNNHELRDHGMFDDEGEYYEVKRILDNKIFIDGANVAYAGMNRDEHAKPKIANILSIALELKKMRFENIVVISDASLRHRVVDKKVMEDLKKQNVTYLEAPAATSADEFLIDCAHKEKCYVVSNDTFRDWKQRDPWAAENIDRLRIPFMIVQGSVSLLIKEKSVAD